MTWVTPRTYVDGETLTASIFNGDLRDNLNWLHDGEAWQNVNATVGWANSWTDYDTTGFGPVRFKRVGGWTVIAGLGANPIAGCYGVTAFTLPVGYRPAHISRIQPSANSDGANHSYNVSISGTGSSAPGAVSIGVAGGTGPCGFASFACMFPSEV